MTYLVILFSVIMLIAPHTAHTQEIRLIVRGDDLGMTQGSLAAFEKAFTEGVLTCASLLVNAPWFEGAAGLANKYPGWCVGVHLNLVGEWRGYRWRPVLPWDKVKSIVDQDGFLYRYPEELWGHKPKLEEIDAELRAQIDLAGKKGIRVQYLDLHYTSPSECPGLDDVVKRLGKEYNLPISGTLGEKRLSGIYKTPVEKKTERAVKMLEGLQPGLWLWVTHPGIESPEHAALLHTKPEDVFTDGGVGQHRAAETKALVSTEVKMVIQNRGIKLTTYRDLWREKQGRGLQQR